MTLALVMDSADRPRVGALDVLGRAARPPYSNETFLKGLRLIADDKLRPISHVPGKSWMGECDGDHGCYGVAVVTIEGSDPMVFCDCPARHKHCAHILGALSLLVIDGEPSC